MLLRIRSGPLRCLHLAPDKRTGARLELGDVGLLGDFASGAQFTSLQQRVTDEKVFRRRQGPLDEPRYASFCSLVVR
jgi:hypothetical protein